MTDQQKRKSGKQVSVYKYNNNFVLFIDVYFFVIERKFKVITKNPSKSSDIPNNVPYLLIGGGTASFSAFRAIKSADPKAKVKPEFKQATTLVKQPKIRF